MAKSEVIWRKAAKSLQRALTTSTADVFSDAAITILDYDAYDFLLGIGGTQAAEGLIPIYTGNLHDSIGVRILKGNTIARARIMPEVTPKLATKPQSMRGVKNIWGDEAIMRVINRPSRRTGKGVVAQLMIGVPYAESVNQKSGYFDELKELFTTSITRNISSLKKKKYIVEV